MADLVRLPGPQPESGNGNCEPHAAAGVAVVDEDEAELGVAGGGQSGAVLGGLEHGHHRHVVHGLRPRRVI